MLVSSLEVKRNNFGSYIAFLLLVLLAVVFFYRIVYPQKEKLLVNGTFTINVGSSIVFNGTAEPAAKIYFEYSIHEIGEKVNFLLLDEKLYQDYLSFKEKRYSGEQPFFEISRSRGGVLYGDPVLKQSSYVFNLWTSKQNPEYYFIIDNGRGISFGTHAGAFPHGKITITLKVRFEK